MSPSRPQSVNSGWKQPTAFSSLSTRNRGNEEAGVVNPFEIFDKLIDETNRKIKALEALGVDTDPRLRDKWIVMEKTKKVIDHKVAALKEQGGKKPLDRPAIVRGLDRAIKAAELLNLQLDDLLGEAAKKP
jgi:hypothetical protein